MDFVEADAWVWFRHEEEKWLPCRVTTGGTELELVDQDGTKYSATGARYSNVDRSRSSDFLFVLAGADCLPMHETSLSPVPNMVDLGDLNEASILHNLRSRYRWCVPHR